MYMALHNVLTTCFSQTCFQPLHPLPWIVSFILTTGSIITGRGGKEATTHPVMHLSVWNPRGEKAPPPPTLKTSNFIIYFPSPGKYLEFAQKVWKTWNFNLKPRKKNLEICKFCVSRFTLKNAIHKNNLIYIFVISILTQTHWPGILLLLPGNNLENTWNFVSLEKWEPCFSSFVYWELFIFKVIFIKFCFMKYLATFENITYLL